MAKMEIEATTAEAVTEMQILQIKWPPVPHLAGGSNWSSGSIMLRSSYRTQQDEPRRTGDAARPGAAYATGTSNERLANPECHESQRRQMKRTHPGSDLLPIHVPLSLMTNLRNTFKATNPMPASG